MDVENNLFSDLSKVLMFAIDVCAELDELNKNAKATERLRDLMRSLTVSEFNGKKTPRIEKR